MKLPYAGHDPEEGKPGYYAERQGSRRHRAYLMFRAGRDTKQIAERFRVKEHQVLKWISIERAHRLGLPCPYSERAAA